MRRSPGVPWLSRITLATRMPRASRINVRSNAVIGGIHDRMPVILDERMAEDWMKPCGSGAALPVRPLGSISESSRHPAGALLGARCLNRSYLDGQTVSPAIFALRDHLHLVP